MGDAGYIGEELWDNSPESELEHLCYVVHKTIVDGIFTIEEALDVYQLCKEDYENYLKNLD